MSKFFEFRAYIGPEWLPDTSAYHYNWSALNAGVATNAGFSTTLSSQLSAAGTTANVGSASSFPAVGGIWIGPAAGGEGWEYMRYGSKGATSFNSLVRDTSNREHTGIHSSGAPVRFWYPITTDDGNLKWTSQLNDKWATKYWTATLTGVLVPKNVIRPKHAVLIQRRTTPTASFTNFLLGWITDATMGDSGRYDAPWTIEIGSSPLMVQQDEAPVFAVGTINIAAGGTASPSSTMAAAWKERDSSDYAAAYPSFSGDNVADDESDSVWISEKMIGSGYTEYVVGGGGTLVNDPSVMGTGTALLLNQLVITQLHITLAAGQPQGYRWLEITALDDWSFAGVELYIGTYDGTTLTFGGAGGNLLRDMEAGERIIICENEERFNEENPGNGASQIVDLRTLGSPDFLANLSVSNDSIGLWRASGGGNRWLHYVCWGTRTTVTVTAAGGPYVSPTWSGTTISGMTANSGKTLRYNWANSATAKNNYTYDMAHYPGYELGSAPEWIMLRMPAMGLTLKNTLASGVTGLATLTTPGGDTTVGLEQAGSITIQIGSEQMTASVSNATQINITARAQNGTSTAQHLAGDPIFVVVSGVATDAFKVTQVHWERAGGTIYPKDFKAYTSTLESPRTPEDAGFTADWSTIGNITGNLAATWSSAAISTRPRWIMISATKMTTDPARMRLNTIKATLDIATMQSSTTLAAADAGDLIVAILDYVGVPSGAISNAFSGANFAGNATGKGKAWAVVADICDYSACMVECDLMSKLTILGNNFWTASIFTVAKTWTRANSTNPSFNVGMGNGVSQVQINWSTPDKAESGTAVYPASPVGLGEIKTYDDQIYDSDLSAAVAAQNMYLMERYGWSIAITPTEDDNTNILGGETHRVTWDIDPDLPDVDRTFIVTSVEHTVSKRVPMTRISGVEIQRYGDEQ